MEKVSQIFGGVISQCEIHKKQGLIFASLNRNDPNPFYCSTCAVKRYKETVPFISIQDIIESDESEQPIQNWPPGINDDDIRFLSDKQTELIKDKLSQGIMEFYDNLQNQVNTIINQSRKEQFNELDKLDFGSENVLDLYNKLFNRKELVRIFENFSKQSKDQYKKLLDSMSTTSEKDLEILQSCIKEKKEQEIKFRQFQDNSIKGLSDKFTSILNNLSLSLFKQDEEGVTEKYDFQEINQSQDKESINNEQRQKQKSLESEPYSLADKQLFLSPSQNYLINYLSNGVTEVKNPYQKEGYCIDIYNIDESQTFKIKFYNTTSFENFQFGFYGYFLSNEEINESDKVVYKEFWKKVIQLTQENISEDDDLVYSFSINLSEHLLKVESQFFDLVQKLNDFKPNYYYKLLFVLQEECEGFEISEFTYSE